MTANSLSEESRYLRVLAERIASAYVSQVCPRAILLTGSVAGGVSDTFSDLDLIAYYDRLPTEDQLAATRALLSASDVRTTGGRDTEASVEEFAVQGIECQVAHFTMALWERQMASILEKCVPATQFEKAILGLLEGVSLHGEDVIRRWQTLATVYPEDLARATVEHYLQFFPLWLAAERWKFRDATIFYHQMLVEASLNILGVLAGLNHLYYSTFQVKRLHRFASKMRIAPERLADRLDMLFALGPVEAGDLLERLVDETATLVEARMPTVDTTEARRHIGVRHYRWIPASEPMG